MTQSSHHTVPFSLSSATGNPMRATRVPPSFTAVAVPLFLLLALVVNSSTSVIPVVLPTPPYPHTLVLGTLFLCVSLMAAVGYLGTGETNLLFLGGATLVYGAGNWALASFSRGNHTLDAGAAYSAFALFSAIFHIGAAFTPRLAPLILDRWHSGPSFARSVFLMVALYFGLAMCIGLYLLANLILPIPSICYSGTGCVQIQQSMLSAAAVLYAMSAFAIWRTSIDSTSRLPEWYASSLALSSIGLWIGERSFLLGTLGAYLGSFCLVIGVALAFRRQVRARDPLEQAKASFSANIDEHFSTLVNTIPSPVLLCDERGTILMWNKQAETELGYGGNKAIGKRCSELFIAESSREMFDRAWLNLVESETGSNQSNKPEIQVRCMDGRLFDAELTLGASLVGDHKFGIAILHDLTAIRQLSDDVKREKEESARSAAELSALSKELKSLSDLLGGNLKETVLAIDQSASIFHEEYADTLAHDPRNLLLGIRRGSQRALGMIDQIVAFARVEYLPLKTEPVNTTQIISSVLEEIADSHAGRNVQVTVDDLPYCTADPQLLRQVFQILVSNSLKFTRGQDPARIHISASGNNGSPPTFCVRDNGAGFSMQQADRLFGVFQRLHHSDEFEGNGVGLATLRRIVRKHGGRVWAEGEPGHGASFYFALGSACCAY